MHEVVSPVDKKNVQYRVGTRAHVALAAVMNGAMKIACRVGVGGPGTACVQSAATDVG